MGKSKKREIGRWILVVGFTLALAGAAALLCHILIVTNPYREWTAPERGVLLGAGTENDPYLIGTLEDLCTFRNKVNCGNDFAGAHFIQTQDIDMSACENWTPIGVCGSGSRFAGDYDGNGHVLRGLTITGEGRNALFGEMSGTVRNLGIESGSVEGTFAAAIVSRGARTAEIYNCYSKAAVHGTWRASGIADNFEGKISRCWNFGEVTSDTRTVGGVTVCPALIDHCYSAGCPVVPGSFYGLDDSAAFVDPEEIDLLLGEANGQIEAADGETPLLCRDGDSVCFAEAAQEREPQQTGTRMKRYAFAGAGTEEDPYLIASLEDLSKFRDLVNEGNAFDDTYFLQTRDIDMSPCGNWTPIGICEQEKYFYGVYDGGGHVIQNLTIRSAENSAFFGLLCGTVKNLGIESGYIEGACVGSVASHGVAEAEIYNCYNKATVHGAWRAGGIVDNLNGGKVSFCWNFGELVCDAGVIGGISSYDARIDHCYSFGLPPVPAEPFGVTNSCAFLGTERLDALLAEVYAGDSAESPDAEQANLPYRDGDGVRLEVRPYKEWMWEDYGFAGRGLESDPYLIADLEDLTRLRDLVNEGRGFARAYFMQTRNIDMSACGNWTPIGVFESGNYFYGIYDGNGHALRNLTSVAVEGGSSYNGLFGLLCGEVRNLGIESGYIEGDCVGAVTSHGSEEAEIYNCYNKATVHGVWRAGGIADNFSGKISDCWNFGDVACDTDSLGGISSYSAQIDHCYSHALPAVPAEFTGTVTDSETFEDAGQIDDLLVRSRVHLAAAHAQETQEPLLIWDGERARFEGHVRTEPAQPGKLGFSGAGTEGDPYLIASPEDLSLFRDLVNEGNEFEGAFFMQTQDIDMSSCGNWTPIGVPGSDNYFRGVYDGNGFALYNLRIVSKDENSGLFGMLCGTVQNLGIESGYIKGACEGSITSHGSAEAEIRNCYNKAMVYGVWRAGGIADNFGGIITGCWNFGEVVCDNGAMGGISSYNAKIKDCYSYGALPVPREFIGTIKDTRVVFTSRSMIGLLDRLVVEAFEEAAEEEQIPLTVAADNDFWFDGDHHRVANLAEYGFSGSGTEEDPYLIAGLDDLVEFRDMVNSGRGFDGCFFRQTQDIDMSACGNWTPIGRSGTNKYFYGVYDGGGHVVQNLTICGTDNCALFGLLCGTVKNLGIESGYIEGACVGSIASHGIQASEVYNCYNKAAVHGSVRAGGIVDNLNGGRVSYCWNFGEITSESGAKGGISSYSAQVDHCYSREVPEVTAGYSWTCADCAMFHTGDEMDVLLDASYAGMYADGTDAGEVPFMVRDGDAVRFDSAYTPARFERKNIADYGFLFVLAVAAAAAVVFAVCFLWSRRAPAVSAGPAAAREEAPEPAAVWPGRARAAVGTALFLALLCGGMFLVERTLYLKRDDGVVPVENYYRQPEDSVDVVMVGSSRTGVNMVCDVLWKEQGISSFDLWGNTQSLWNSYYYVCEALRCGNPKVIALEVSSLRYGPEEYADEGKQYSNLQGLETSLNKLEAIQASAPQEQWLDLLLGFPIYHGRYAELQKNDFERYFLGEPSVVEKGSQALYGFGTLTSQENAGKISGIKEPPEKIKEYFLRILEKCASENVSLVLFATDCSDRSIAQPYYNYVAQMAEAWDIPFINFDLLDSETGFTVDDFYSDNGHVNMNGARKLSSYFGRYLKEHYDLEDHRGDPYYSSWDAYVIGKDNAYFSVATRTSDYLKEMLRDDRTAVLIRQSLPDGNAKLEAFRQTAEETGFDTAFLEEEGDRCWVFQHTPDMTAYESAALDGAVDIPLGEGTLTVDPYSTRTVAFDGKTLCGTQSGLMCVIYDTNTGAVVDKCMLVESSGAAGTVRHM